MVSWGSDLSESNCLSNLWNSCSPTMQCWCKCAGTLYRFSGGDGASGLTLPARKPKLSWLWIPWQLISLAAWDCEKCDVEFLWMDMSSCTHDMREGEHFCVEICRVHWEFVTGIEGAHRMASRWLIPWSCARGINPDFGGSFRGDSRNLVWPPDWMLQFSISVKKKEWYSGVLLHSPAWLSIIATY